MKKIYFENLGCAKNQVDAEVMATVLEKKGYEIVLYADEADVIVINTCAFIESAKEESVKTFFELKNAYPNAKIIVSGCLSQRYATELGTELTEADAVFGNRDLSKIEQVTSVVLKSSGSERPYCLVPESSDFSDEDENIILRKPFFSYKGSAFVKISEGCNHYCSYCAIPFIRGNLKSRSENSILQEVRNLVAAGVVEINLIAQDLLAYGTDWDRKSHFVELLEKINRLEGNFKIRMLYLHPDLLTCEILEKISKCEKVLHYFDIPFQHVGQKILLSMGRTGNAEKYTELVRSVRSYFPDAAIRTTIMLGYPGDTQQDFSLVCEFLKNCHFTWMGCFLYSFEENTKAYEMTNLKEHKALIKSAKKWKTELENLQQIITLQELKNFVGKTYKVLIEEVFTDRNLAIGRIYAQAPEVDGLTLVSGPDMECGKLYLCKITDVDGVDFHADIVQ